LYYFLLFYFDRQIIPWIKYALKLEIFLTQVFLTSSEPLPGTHRSFFHETVDESDEVIEIPAPGRIKLGFPLFREKNTFLKWNELENIT